MDLANLPGVVRNFITLYSFPCLYQVDFQDLQGRLQSQTGEVADWVVPTLPEIADVISVELLFLRFGFPREIISPFIL